MAKKGAFDLLNVSFLDIFACTIGAVLFIVIILFLASLELVPREQAGAPEDRAASLESAQADLIERVASLRDRVEKARSDQEAARKDAARDREELTRARAEARENLGKHPALETLRKDAAERRERLEKARAMVRGARAKLAEAEAEAAESERTLKEAKEGRVSGSGGKPVEFRIPLVRTTGKTETIYFECRDGRAFWWSPSACDVHLYFSTPQNRSAWESLNKTWGAAEKKWELIAEFRKVLGEARRILERRPWKGILKGDAFSIEPISDRDAELLTVTLRAGAVGSSKEEIVGGKSPVGEVLGRLKPQVQRVFIIVHPSGFETFRALRARLDDLGVSKSWDYLDEGEPYTEFIGPGGGGPATEK